MDRNVSNRTFIRMERTYFLDKARDIVKVAYTRADIYQNTETFVSSIFGVWKIRYD